jgi:hypothetical protein
MLYLIFPILAVATNWFQQSATVTSVLEFRRLGAWVNIAILPIVIQFINNLAWFVYGLVNRDVFLMMGTFGMVFPLFGVLTALTLTHSQRSHPGLTKLRTEEKFLLSGLLYYLITGTILMEFGSVEIAVDTYGYSAMILSAAFNLSPFRQLPYIFRQWDSSPLCPPALLANIFGCLIWTVYGFTISDMPIIIPSAIGFTVNTFFYLLCLCIPNHSESNTEIQTRGRRLSITSTGDVVMESLSEITNSPSRYRNGNEIEIGIVAAAAAHHPHISLHSHETFIEVSDHDNDSHYIGDYDHSHNHHLHSHDDDYDYDQSHSIPSLLSEVKSDYQYRVLEAGSENGSIGSVHTRTQLIDKHDWYQSDLSEHSLPEINAEGVGYQILYTRLRTLTTATIDSVMSLTSLTNADSGYGHTSTSTDINMTPGITTRNKKEFDDETFDVESISHSRSQFQSDSLPLSHMEGTTGMNLLGAGGALNKEMEMMSMTPTSMIPIEKKPLLPLYVTKSDHDLNHGDSELGLVMVDTLNGTAAIPVSDKYVELEMPTDNDNLDLPPSLRQRAVSAAILPSPMTQEEVPENDTYGESEADETSTSLLKEG